jgi:hypothetical protein
MKVIKSANPMPVSFSDFLTLMYEGHLKSSWTRLITPSRNFVKVR